MALWQVTEKDIHSGFEQHIETVGSLNEFEGDANKEELLELIDHKSTLPELDDEKGDKASMGDDEIEEIPSVRFIASPAQPTEPYVNIQDIDGHEPQEKHI